MCRGGDIIETNHGALVGYPQSRLGQGANGAEGCHIIEGHQHSETAPVGQQFFHCVVASFGT